MKNLSTIHTIMAAAFIACAAYSLTIGNENTSALRRLNFRSKNNDNKSLHIKAVKKQGIDFLRETEKVVNDLKCLRIGFWQ